MNTIITQENKFNERDFSLNLIGGENYKYTKITPLTKSEYTISGGGSENISFRIPTVAHNPAQSFLRFDLSTDTKAEAKTRVCVCLDTVPMLDSIKVTTESGYPLMDINYVRQYLKLMNPRQTSMKEYLSQDRTTSTYYPSGENNVKPYIDEEEKDPEKTFGGLNFTYSSSDGKIITGDGTNPTGTTTAAVSAYSDNKHILLNDYGWNPTTTGILEMKGVCVSMSSIKNTFLSIDKTIMLPTNYTIDFKFSNPEQTFWVSSDTDGKVSEYKGSAIVSNINLYLATEEEKEADVKAQLASADGIQVLVPLVQSTKRSEGKSQSITQQIDISRALGNKLKRIYISPFNTATRAPLCIDNSISDDSKGLVLSYYSQFNNKRIQPFDITITDNMDYILYRKRHPPGSDAIINKAHYYRNWCIEENFDNKNAPVNNNVTSGKQLDAAQYTYDCIIRSSGEVAADFYRFIVYEKTLIIKSDGITYV